MPAKPLSKLSFRQQLEARERECFQVLARLSPERNYVLIGGYAVSSYHFPRYSVDLDIVTGEEDLGLFQELARTLGFIRSRGREDVEPVYRGRSESYVKDTGVKVRIDLFVNAVQSRDTGCVYSFKHILANSEVREVRGRGLAARATARVADKEMLIALKALPMRPQDMGDILALCYEPPSAADVIAHLKKCPQRILEKIGKLQAFVENPKTDSVRGAFSFGTREFKQCIENCQSLVLEANKSLSELSKTAT